MRIDRDLLGWGVFFAVAGGLALAVHEGAIADRAWWSFWPLILVGIGIGLILRGTPLDAIGGLLVAATFGLMVGGSLAGGVGGSGSLPAGVYGPGDSVLTGHTFATAGVVEVDDLWETPGFDGATTRIDPRTEAQ